MREPTLTELRLAGGVWTGRLTGVAGEPPPLELLHEAERVGVPRVTEDDNGTWLVDVDIPGGRLSEGIQTFVIAQAGTATPLATIPFVCGRPLAGDIRAEIDLLRDELDMLRRAFRRHCIETAQIAADRADDS